MVPRLGAATMISATCDRFMFSLSTRAANSLGRWHGGLPRASSRPRSSASRASTTVQRPTIGFPGPTRCLWSGCRLRPSFGLQALCPAFCQAIFPCATFHGCHDRRVFFLAGQSNLKSRQCQHPVAYAERSRNADQARLLTVRPGAIVELLDQLDFSGITGLGIMPGLERQQVRHDHHGKRVATLLERFPLLRVVQ